MFKIIKKLILLLLISLIISPYGLNFVQASSLPTVPDSENSNRHYFVALFSYEIWRHSDGSWTAEGWMGQEDKVIPFDYSFEAPSGTVIKNVTAEAFTDQLRTRFGDEKFEKIFYESRYESTRWSDMRPMISKSFSTSLTDLQGKGTTSASMKLTVTGDLNAVVAPEETHKNGGSYADNVVGYRYYFPTLLTIDVEPIEKPKQLYLTVKHFLKDGTSLAGVFPNYEETKEVGEEVNVVHPTHEDYKYIGHAKTSTGALPSINNMVAGDPGKFTYDGSFENYIVYFYYDTDLPTPPPKPPDEPDDPGGPNITGDFDIIPNQIEYRESFTLRPKDIQTNNCTYLYHEFKIERDGMFKNSPDIYGKTKDLTYTYNTYPSVIGVGTHDVYMKIYGSCGETEWIGPKPLVVTGSGDNSPPDFAVGWTIPGVHTQAGVVTQVVEGTYLDLVYLDEPPMSDPDGDPIEWLGFDFAGTNNSWLQSIPSKYEEYTEGWLRIKMDKPGYYSIKASIRDTLGAVTTKTATVQVVPPNPVPVITGPNEVVEGRPLPSEFSSEQSYSPINGRKIDHSRDIWTNVKEVYDTVGKEIITLEVFDELGLKSVAPAQHTLTVKPDLPPVAELDYAEKGLRTAETLFKNTSYSPDNDRIVVNRVTYRYDSNNDGSFDNETEVNIRLDDNNEFLFKPSKVGKYLFTVYVEEDWGKNDTSTFAYEALNDSPEAQFSVKGEVLEPVLIPPTPIDLQQIVSNQNWKNSNMYHSSYPKLWAYDPIQKALTSISNELENQDHYNSISSSNVKIAKFRQYRSVTGNWNNFNYGEYGAYVGNDTVLGIDLWLDEIEPAKALYDSGEYKYLTPLSNSTVMQIDYERGIVHTYDERNCVNSGYRLSDLLNEDLSEYVPIYSNSNVVDGRCSITNNPYYYVRNHYNEFNYDYKKLGYGSNLPTITSYTWENLIEEAESRQADANFDSYSFSQFGHHSRDTLGNYYKDDQINYYSGFTLKKIDGSTGEILWSVPRAGTEAVNDYNLASNFDGTIIASTEGNAGGTYTKYIVFRNASDGSVLKKVNLGTTFPGNPNSYAQEIVIGSYEDVLVTGAKTYTNIHLLRGWDFNGNLLWSLSVPKSLIDRGYTISQDGYLLFMDKEFILNIVSMRNGSKAGTINLSNTIHGRHDYGEHSMRFDLELVEDGKLYLKYWYSEGTDQTDIGALLIKTDTLSNAAETTEKNAYGQLIGPDELANLELHYDLKLNKKVYSGQKNAGFGFRIQDHKNMYRVESDEQTTRLVKIVNGTKTTLNSVNYKMEYFESYKFKINAFGNRIKVYINGVPLIEVIDDTFTSGRYGPYASISRAKFMNLGYVDLGDNLSLVNSIALVDEKVKYSTSYLDPENDLKIDELTTWTYKHTNPNKFLNAGDGKSGLSQYHNKTVNSAILSFDKVGMYQISYKVKDDPNLVYRYPNNTFAEYRKDSSPWSENVIVHRKPIASFTVSINSDYTVKWTDNSYDPDRWLSSSNYSSEPTGINYRTTRGILERRYYYVTPSGSTVYSQLITPRETGEFVVGLVVKDEYGAWSDWAVRTIHVTQIPEPDEPPVPGFTINPTTTYRGVPITINSTAYDVEDGARENLPHEYYIRNVTDGGLESFQSNSRTQWTKTFNTMGTFSIRQVVFDSLGQSATITKTINVVNRKPAANITYPTSTDANNPTILKDLRPTFTWSYTDADGDAQTKYQVQIYHKNGSLLRDTGVMGGNPKSWIPTVDLPDKTTMYVIVRVFDGYDWSDWSARKYFYTNGNEPPNANFDWTPKPVWEGDTVRLINQSTDPDGDPLTYLWKVTFPDGTSQTFTQTDVTLKFTQIGIYRVHLTADDGELTDSVEKVIEAKELILEPSVYHTDEWKAIHDELGHETETDPKDFYSGEIFILQAFTSPAPVQRVRAWLDTEGRAGNSIYITSDLSPSLEPTRYQGELYDEVLMSLTEGLNEGMETIWFEVQYANGVVKQAGVQVRMIGLAKEAAGVHRRR
ncbi:PKD domain-containing protein [Marinicrinis lubricantis]|uniref:PKD domain-containing protein n=1 Tax=Marinicrinis lubricantis TaxID=2086470 RepID=A0ABW1IPM5_9BACL